jgi:FixJ family two-component response regulator
MATERNSTAFIAIVDDDSSVRSAVQDLLKTVGLQARTFASAEEFLSSGQQHHIACLIADIRMPGMSGLDLQAQLNADQIKVPIIFVTAHDDPPMRLRALRAGALEFLAKPFDEDHLVACVWSALKR